MKRYRVTTFHIDATRNVFRGRLPMAAAMAIAKKEMEGSLKAGYGEFNFDQKFERYMALEKPVLSIVAEHSSLLEDICNAYVSGNLYSALTGACCLGERIFNDVIFRVMDDFKSSRWYKAVYGKGSVIDWDKAIEILNDWGILSDEVEEKYLRLKRLRDESVHYQKEPQDLAAMSLEAINLVNFIISRLFGLDEHRKDILLLFDVPGEVFLKKSAERDPLAKAFYIPCAALVGPEYEISYDSLTGRFHVSDENLYEEKEIDDDEFVRLRNEYSGKTVLRF
jgi:hypothetical protein